MIFLAADTSKQSSMPGGSRGGGAMPLAVISTRDSACPAWSEGITPANIFFSSSSASTIRYCLSATSRYLILNLSRHVTAFVPSFVRLNWGQPEIKVNTFIYNYVIFIAIIIVSSPQCTIRVNIKNKHSSAF